MDVLIIFVLQEGTLVVQILKQLYPHALVKLVHEASSQNTFACPMAQVDKGPAWLFESAILVSHVMEALSQTREDDLAVCKVILAQTTFFGPLLLAFVFTFLATEVLCQKLKEAVLVVYHGVVLVGQDRLKLFFDLKHMWVLFYLVVQKLR